MAVSDRSRRPTSNSSQSLRRASNSAVFGRQTQRRRWNHQQRPHCCLCYRNRHKLSAWPCLFFHFPLPLSPDLAIRHTTRNKNRHKTPHLVWRNPFVYEWKVEVAPRHPVQAQGGSGGTVQTHSQYWRYKGTDGQHHARPLYPGRELVSTAEGCVGLGAGLDRHGKSRPHRGSKAGATGP